MLRLGGTYRKSGTYWSAVDGSIHRMQGGGTLPGGTGVLYIRRPMGGMWVATPAIALAYAATFPALGPLAVIMAWTVASIGIAALLVAGMVKAVSGTRELAVMGWRPVTAYFAGLKKRDKKK